MGLISWRGDEKEERDKGEKREGAEEEGDEKEQGMRGNKGK